MIFADISWPLCDWVYFDETIKGMSWGFSDWSSRIDSKVHSLQTCLCDCSKGLGLAEGCCSDSRWRQVQRLHVYTPGRVQEQQHGVHHEQEVPQGCCQHENGNKDLPLRIMTLILFNFSNWKLPLEMKISEEELSKDQMMKQQLLIVWKLLMKLP